MTRLPRVTTATPLLALSVCLAIGLMSPVTVTSAHQDASPVPVTIGSGPVREQSLALTGRNIYHPDTIELFGYLTGIIGLDPSLLFIDASPSERSARFTYAGEISHPSRSDRGDVSTFQGTGALRIYLDEGGASWDDPSSFADGQPLAEFSIRLRDTLQRQAPGVGVLVGDGALSQGTALEFTLDGNVYRFGAAGIEQRVRYVGAVMQGGVESPAFVVNLTGNASVAVREAIPVNVGQSAAAVATPFAGDCPNLQPWLDQTMNALVRAGALAAVPDDSQDVSSPDDEAVLLAAAEMASLAEAQRRITPPDAAAEPNRLVVTALSTSARGLEVIATAATKLDSELLAQGQTVHADGGKLLQRATNEVTALAGACSPPQELEMDPA